MPFFIVLALCLLPLSVLAADDGSQPPILSRYSVTLIHPAPNIDFYFDQHGNTETIYHHYHQGAGLSWYCRKDRSGRIISQGYLSDPLPRPEPLTMPRSTPSSSDPFDYLHRDMNGLTR